MSTKQETTNQYDPTAMGVFHNLQPAIQNVLLDAMGDPKKSSFFLQNWQQMQKQNQGMLARSVQNIGQSLAGRGISPNSALYDSMIQRATRASSANTNNAYLQALQMASNRQMDSTRMAQGYSPLQTGQVTTTSGLGTWLPQVLGAAAAIGLAPFTGGTSLMGLAGVAGKGSGGAVSQAVGGPRFAPTYSSNTNSMWIPYQG